MEKNLRCILIDDEPKASANLENLLKSHPEIRIISVLNDASDAVETILDSKPDLLFLDIQIPGKTGFEIAKELHDAGDPPAIIFVTGFDRFAIEAIRHAAFDFLVKPVNPEELAQSIERLQNVPSKSVQLAQFTKLIERTLSKPKIKISNTGGFSLINPADIIYIQADWNYSELFFGVGKSELATMNIGSLEESLPVKYAIPLLNIRKLERFLE